MKNSTIKIFFSVILPIILYAISIIFAIYDTNFSYRWLIFALWISACLIPFVFFAITNKAYVSLKNIYILFKKDSWLPTIVIFTAIVLSFSLLKEYPFVAIYDQVRDGGLNAMEIANGTFLNIFGFGRYASHGAIIPTITSFFFIFFQNSVFTYRIPAAILAIIDTLLLYVLVRKISGKYSAFFAALTLTTLPLHMFYARTEIVVMWSEFFTLINLLLFYLLTKQKNLFAYILLGIGLGFGSGFHTSARTVSIGIGLIAIGFSLYDSFIRKRFRSLLGIVLLVLFYFVGFGPRILYTTPEIFFQTRSFTLSGSTHTSFITLGTNYWKSLLVYIKEPTFSTHYPDFKPILTPILSILFLFGIMISLLSKKFFTYVLIFLTLALPFTNSAITEAVNSDNRLLPLVILASLFTGIGVGEIIYYVKKYFRKIGFLFFFSAGTAYLLFQGFLFFWNEPANKAYGVQDYLSMHTVYTLQENDGYQQLSNFCFFVSPTSFDYLQLLHVQEQYEYFLPNKTITVVKQPEVPDNQLFISSSCNFSDIQHRSSVLVFCNPTEKFVCPKNSLFVNFIENPLYTKKTPSNLESAQTFVIPPKPVVIP